MVFCLYVNNISSFPTIAGLFSPSSWMLSVKRLLRRYGSMRSHMQIVQHVFDGTRSKTCHPSQQPLAELAAVLKLLLNQATTVWDHVLMHAPR
ncbi:hypothetical protein CPB83DRAFT_856645 [Crepidotus variabilis]|uniref:Uncharacterized protein n=1 Tax=Crepidotus variabilis TaxID=179855 RepID=A0A9P6EEE2_9AGAR|nr:hypothetical protein CPB83DRAFT_856645 [Crepidotus variabilis]